MKLYKNRYLIALYDENDECIVVLDNSAELASYLNTNRNITDCLLWKVSKGLQSCVICNNKVLDIYLIDVKEGEE